MSASTGRPQRLNEGMLRLAARAQHPMLYRRDGRTLDPGTWPHDVMPAASASLLVVLGRPGSAAIRAPCVLEGLGSRTPDAVDLVP